MATSPPSTIFHDCRSSKLDGLDRHDSDHILSTAVEDEKSKDEKDMGDTLPAMNLEPWRPVSPKSSFNRNIALWRKRRTLGQGSYGVVYEAMTDDGCFFAVKEVSLLDEGMKGNQRLSRLEQEAEFLSRFEHENIVQCIGTDKDDENLYVFLELMSKGSLLNLYCKRPLTESQVSAYTSQILKGLKYLHDQKVIHRNIKCANILVDASGSVKLAGFGSAEVIDSNDEYSMKGTVPWMAPEVLNIKGKGSCGSTADIWSLGCTVLEMLTRAPPYSGIEPVQVMMKLSKGECPQVPNFLSKDAQHFICTCLQQNPEKRPSAAELLGHPFVMKPPTSGFAGPQYKTKLS